MDEVFLARALELARPRRGFCAPNPSVGAVLVRAGQIIAEGAHWAAGHPHAEVEALKNTPGPLSDCTLYVSLEPCCHFGKTPPCTDLILGRQIGRVVFGFTDPNPKVAGGGQARLRAQGVECTHLALPAIDDFYASYAHWTRTGLPRITAKLALGPDGAVAMADGRPAVITAEQCRVLTHQERRQADAILTSHTTVSADNPSLNVRLTEPYEKKKVYILDSRLQTPHDIRLKQTAEALCFLHGPDAPSADRAYWQANGAQLYEIAPDEKKGEKGSLSWPAILQRIGQDGIHDLWVEAGPALFQSLLDQRVLQRALLYRGAVTIPGATKKAWEQLPTGLFEAKSAAWSALGPDTVCELRF